jgi:hypothetical protein
MPFKGKGDVDMIIAILWLISASIAFGLVWAALQTRTHNVEAAWISIATLVCMAFFVLLVVQPAHS